MRLPLTMLLLAVALAAGACGGAAAPPANAAPQVEAVIVPPLQIRAGSDVVWRVNINGYNGPFTVNWDFGGGAVVNEHSFSNELSPNLLKVGMINSSSESKSYTVRVSVTDKVGATDTTTFSYKLQPQGTEPPDDDPPDDDPPDDDPPDDDPPAGNRPPVIEGFSVEDGLLSVSTSDPDGDAVKVTVVDEFGTEIGIQSGEETQFELDLWVGFWLQRDIGLTITASDGSESTTAQAAYSPTPVDIQPNTLYAVATTTTASHVAEPTTVGNGNGVRVIVFTGATEFPFRSLTGLALTCEDSADYVRGSFDIGIPDGSPDAEGITGIDGIWADLDASNLDVTPDDRIGGIFRRDLPGPRSAFDFSIVPQNATELRGAEGVLFSIELAFSQAGEYRIGFQPVDTISRTYYQDADEQVDYFWGDVTNSTVPNIITVD